MLIKESMMYVCTYSKRKYIRHRNRHHKCAQLSAGVVSNVWQVILQNSDSETFRSGTLKVVMQHPNKLISSSYKRNQRAFK